MCIKDEIKTINSIIKAISSGSLDYAVDIGVFFDVPIDTYPWAEKKAKIDEIKCLPNNDSLKEYTLGPIFLKER